MVLKQSSRSSSSHRESDESRGRRWASNTSQCGSERRQRKMVKSTGPTTTSTGRLAQTLASAASHFRKSFGNLSKIMAKLCSHTQCQGRDNSCSSTFNAFFFICVFTEDPFPFVFTLSAEASSFASGLCSI